VGYYIEVPEVFFNKADKIIKIFDARLVAQEQAEAFVEDGAKAVICVVTNPNFEAAAFCYSPEEFKRFTYKEDPRPKAWLVIADRPLIEEITGYKKDAAVRT
jgi:uncharacterized protein (DUF1330 family)